MKKTHKEYDIFEQAMELGAKGVNRILVTEKEILYTPPMERTRLPEVTVLSNPLKTKKKKVTSAQKKKRKRKKKRTSSKSGRLKKPSKQPTFSTPYTVEVDQFTPHIRPKTVVDISGNYLAKRDKVITKKENKNKPVKKQCKYFPCSEDSVKLEKGTVKIYSSMDKNTGDSPKWAHVLYSTEKDKYILKLTGAWFIEFELGFKGFKLSDLQNCCIVLNSKARVGLGFYRAFKKDDGISVKLLTRPIRGKDLYGSHGHFNTIDRKNFEYLTIEIYTKEWKVEKQLKVLTTNCENIKKILVGTKSKKKYWKTFKANCINKTF